jgi:hypothetical protein
VLQVWIIDNIDTSRTSLGHALMFLKAFYSKFHPFDDRVSHAVTITIPGTISRGLDRLGAHIHAHMPPPIPSAY